MIRRLQRWRAGRELERVDADVARWFVSDGQLSDAPLSGPPSSKGKELRARRTLAVKRLEAAGGRDPHPCFTRPPTIAQRDARERDRRAIEMGRLSESGEGER